MIKKFFSILKKNTETKEEERDNSKKIPIEDTKNNNEIELDNDIIELNDSVEIVEEIELKSEQSDEEKRIDEEFILNAKIKRGGQVKAIDIYTEEEQIFKTYKECSRKLKIPEDYIIENLKFGYIDYLGEAIKYLSKELQLNEKDNYLESNKSPLEIFNNLHDKIFTAKISQSKREDILSSEKIEPVKMHYKFESLDYEYDEYFDKYKSIIKRGGKKKIELVDKKGEVIDIFKSLDECAAYLNKEKQEVTDMLKYKKTKVGRYEIRYSLRSI